MVTPIRNDKYDYFIERAYKMHVECKQPEYLKAFEYAMKISTIQFVNKLFSTTFYSLSDIVKIDDISMNATECHEFIVSRIISDCDIDETSVYRIYFEIRGLFEMLLNDCRTIIITQLNSSPFRLNRTVISTEKIKFHRLFEI